MGRRGCGCGLGWEGRQSPGPDSLVGGPAGRLGTVVEGGNCLDRFAGIVDVAAAVAGAAAGTDFGIVAQDTPGACFEVGSGSILD